MAASMVNYTNVQNKISSIPPIKYKIIVELRKQIFILLSMQINAMCLTKLTFIVSLLLMFLLLLLLPVVCVRLFYIHKRELIANTKWFIANRIVYLNWNWNIWMQIYKSPEWLKKNTQFSAMMIISTNNNVAAWLFHYYLYMYECTFFVYISANTFKCNKIQWWAHLKMLSKEWTKNSEWQAQNEHRKINGSVQLVFGVFFFFFLFRLLVENMHSYTYKYTNLRSSFRGICKQTL